MEKENLITEEDKVGPIPRYYHEAETARLERTITRLFWALILVILLLVGTNGWWIWRESQFVDEVTETIETSAEGGGNAYGTIISGDGSEVNYGANESDANKNQGS